MKKLMQEQKKLYKAIEVNKKVNEKYKNWSFPIPDVTTVNWTIKNWSDYIEKNGKKNK